MDQTIAASPDTQDETRPPTRPYRASQKSADANRANAQRSTGPRTPEGKAHSRLNALKHGLLATEAVNRTIEGADARAAFDALTDRLEAHYLPEGPVEEILVEKIAIAAWRLKRLLRFEAKAATDAMRDETHNQLREARERVAVYAQAGLGGIVIPDNFNTTLLLRYETAINRDLYRAMNELRKLRKERASLDQGDAAAVERGPLSDDEKQNYQTKPNRGEDEESRGSEPRTPGEDRGGGGPPS